jgi:transcriptional regulator
MEGKRAKIDFIRQNSFGIMFSKHGDVPCATHTPFIYSEGVEGNDFLFGHMSRANPQWRDLESQMVLVVFQGPHAYISPSWYVEKNQVPTWNYIAVQVTGLAKLLDGEKTKEVVSSLLDFYRSDAYIAEHLREEPFLSQLRGIVGFQISVEGLEGAVKLNQNKSLQSRLNVAEKLLASENPVTRELGRTMMKNISSEN